ncbi:MAG: hydroxymethylbilane synthase [Sedimentisphaerales bacterium]|jgi:hydroxymethylbilane synthase
MKKPLVIATRSGSLAIAQTQIVVSALQKIHPAVNIRIKKMASQGDKDQRTTLWELKSTGFFTSRLEDALLAGQADIAVHSFKDLPTAQREGLSIAAVLDRRFPEDCLVSAKPIKSIDQIPRGAKIGTSSLRRTVQINRLRPTLVCVPIRGNVTTRLRKLEQGDFDAIVLARAGLERLDMSEKISIVFEPTQFIPAPAQGALAVQIRANDIETRELVSKLDDENTRITTTAERLVFSALQCGCHAPAGAFARINNSQITISAFFSEPDGKKYAQTTLAGPVDNYETLTQSLAAKLLRKDIP